MSILFKKIFLKQLDFKKIKMNAEIIKKFEKFRVPNTPKTIFYVPEFISKNEEELIIKNVYSAPKPKWTQLRNRRLQDYGGIPHVNGMITEKIPEWLQKVMNKVIEVFPYDKQPNHVLVNEYLPGQGIMPHTDGPLFYPIITTISCGSHTILNIIEKESRKIITEILLENRSLVILTDDMYELYLHSIDDVESDPITNRISNLSLCSNYDINTNWNRNTRISLTIRHVPKIAKFQLNFLK